MRSPIVAGAVIAVIVSVGIVPRPGHAVGGGSGSSGAAGIAGASGPVGSPALGVPPPAGGATGRSALGGGSGVVAGSAAPGRSAGPRAFNPGGMRSMPQPGATMMPR